MFIDVVVVELENVTTEYVVTTALFIIVGIINLIPAVILSFKFTKH